jgi:hypothetical protein
VRATSDFGPTWHVPYAPLCYEFIRVIKLMTPGNKVSSLITVYDARLMTTRFHNNRIH